MSNLNLASTSSRRQLASVVSALSMQIAEPPPAWFKTWIHLFCETVQIEGGRLSPLDIQQIQSGNPAIGWTVANVFRFLPSIADLQEQLRAIYVVLSDQKTELASTTRWRIAHALGRQPSEENLNVLLRVVDEDSYEWARYGAVRSLIEMSIYAGAGLRRKILIELQQRLRLLGEVPLSQLSWASRHEDAPSDWIEDIMPLVAAAASLAHTKREMEVWENRLEEFEVWKASRS